MSVDVVVTEIEIAVPRAQVAAFAADPGNATAAWRRILISRASRNVAANSLRWRPSCR
jgi:hypothetical protein